MYTLFAASSLVVSVVVELGSAARLLRFLGLFPSEGAVAASLVSVGFTVSWAFDVVCSFFSATFASVANFSFIFSIAFAAVDGVLGATVVTVGGVLIGTVVSVCPFVTLASVVVLVSEATAVPPCPKTINKADTATLAAPKLTLRIEKRVTFSRVEFSILFFNDLFFMIYYLLWLN